MKVQWIKRAVIDRDLIIDWISSDDVFKCLHGFTLAKGRADLNLYDKLHIFEKWKDIMNRNTKHRMGHYAYMVMYNIVNAFDGTVILIDNEDYGESLKRLESLLLSDDVFYNRIGILVAKNHKIPDNILDEWLSYDQNNLYQKSGIKSKFIAAAFNKITKDPNITTVYEILENAPAFTIISILKYSIKMNIIFPDQFIEDMVFKYKNDRYFEIIDKLLWILGKVYQHSHDSRYQSIIVKQSSDVIPARAFSPPKTAFLQGVDDVIAKISIPNDSFIRGSWCVGGRASHVIIDHIDGHLFGQPILIPFYMNDIGYLSPGDELEILDFDLNSSLFGSGFFFSNTLDQANINLPGSLFGDIIESEYHNDTVL